MVCVGSGVRVAPQVAKVLHQHQGAVELLLLKRAILGYSPQRAATGRRVRRSCRTAKFVNRRLALGRRRRHARIDEQKIYKLRRRTRDRKSTRLNSSHANISYAVFCLKKKKATIY